MQEVQSGLRGFRMPWRLDRGVGTCSDANYCPRQVFARFIDAQGYASRPVTADVILDTQPPAVVRGATSVSPSAAKGDSRIVVSLTASETLRGTPSVSVEGAPQFLLSRAFPETEQRSTVFTFVAAQPASVLGSQGHFRVRATMVDLAGNISSDQDVGSFTVDTPPPGLAAVAVEPARVAVTAGKVVTVRFALDDALVGGRFTVSIGGRPVDSCARAGTLPSISVTCTRIMEGDEIPEDTESVEPVLVSAVDEAGNTAEASTSIVFDRKPPRLSDALFAPDIAREGRSVFLSLTADERLTPSAPPTLRWAAGKDLGLSFVSITGLAHNFRRDIDASVSEGTYRLDAVVLEDLAGNTATVSAGALSLVVDKTDPQIQGLRVTPTDIGKTGTLRADFTLSEAPASGGLVVSFQGKEMTCTSSGAAPAIRSRCTWTMTGQELPADTEASELVIVDVTDRAGNSVRDSRRVHVDFHAPAIVNGSVVLNFEPAMNSILYRILGRPASIDKLGLGATAHLSFALDETPRVMPEVRTRTPAVLPFVAGSASLGRSLTYSLTLASAPAQGQYTVEVVVEDALRNRATRSIPIADPNLPFVVDTQPPASPNAQLFLHERFPWGGAAVGARAVARVSASAGAAEPGTLAVILASPGLASPTVIGARDVDARGALPAVELNDTVDRRDVYVALVDGAGNVSGSGGQASHIVHGRWTAAFTQDLDARSPNPHRVELLSFIEPSLDQNPDGARFADTAELNRLALPNDQTGVTVTSPRRWEEMLPTSVSPAPRQGAVLAYDAARGRAVLFGGRGTSDFFDDTWEHDGKRWSQVQSESGHAPEAREQAAMVYDAVRGKMLLFGGRAGARALDDTWTWDGSSWIELSPATRPPIRWGHNMVYLPQQGRVLLYGGAASTQASRQDTWQWDGTNWVAGPPGPPARVGGAMGASANGAVRLAGGLTRAQGGALIEDQWAYDGVRWTSRGTYLPQSRHGALMGYGPDLRWRLFFGSGAVLDSPVDDVLGDYGELARPGAPVGWVSASRAPSPTWPPARLRGAMTFDTRRGALLIFGGLGVNGVLLGDTWSWEENAAFRDLSPDGHWPPSRLAQAAAYDALHHEVVMFGGVADSVSLCDTWAWNGTRFRQGPDSPAPSPRSGATMVGASGGAELLGGEDSSGVIQGVFTDPRTHADSPATETWLWDGSRWTRSVVDPRLGLGPMGSARHAMVMDSLRRAIVVSGGVGISGTFRDGLFERPEAGLTWTTLSVAGPGARTSHAMAFDSARGRTVLFGGVGPTNLDFGDLWEWAGPSATGSQGRWLAPPQGAVGPGARRGHATSYDTARGRTVLDGGGPKDVPAQTDTWEWDGVTWTRLAQTSWAPGPRFGHSLIYDEARRRHVLLAHGNTRLQVWELHADPEQRPGVKLTINFSAAKVEAAETTEAQVLLRGGATGYGVQLPGTGADVTGIVLSSWNAREARWRALAAGNGSSAAPVSGSFGVSGSDVRSMLSVTKRLQLLLEPQAGLGNGVKAPELSIDGIELTLSYVLAP